MVYWRDIYDPLKFSLRATIDHHGPSIHSGHYTASINCCKKLSFAMITQLRSLELLTAKTPLLHMLYYMNWLTHDLWTRTGGVSLITPMALAHPLHPIDNRSRNRRQNLRVGWYVSSWWPLFRWRSFVLIFIYICFSISVLFSLVYQLCLARWW